MRRKLETYSLNLSHEWGGAKARGFTLILGITLDSIDYLEAQILSGIEEAPVVEVKARPPYGIGCAVDFPIRGVGPHLGRHINLRTAWLFSRVEAAPRLTSAYLKP